MMHYSYAINLSEEDKKVLEAIVQFRNTHERFSRRRVSRADVFRTALLRYRDDLAEQYPEAHNILYPDDDIRIEKLLKIPMSNAAIIPNAVREKLGLEPIKNTKEENNHD